MEYICDAPRDKTWFRLVSEGEAALESELMRHAVEKYFRREWDKAADGYRPLTNVFIELDIGKAAHIQREMPLFLTLRDGEGTPRQVIRLHHRGRRQRRPVQAARRRDRGAVRAFRHSARSGALLPLPTGMNHLRR
jgi:hypothetical protein